MGRLQGKKRLLEQSTEDSGFHLEDGPVDGNDLANKSKLALVVQDAGDLIEARLLHEEVGYFASFTGSTRRVSPAGRNCVDLA